MAAELQGLLDRIQEEGVKKAEGEAEAIIAKAKEEAEEIIQKAQTDAEKTAKDAEENASKSEKRANSAIQQAARDVVLSLRADIESRLKKVVAESISDTMTPEQMGQILVAMVKDNKETEDVEVILAQKDIESMEKLFSGSLAKDLKENPEITLGHDFTSGLKIGFKGDDIFFDFSDDALSDIICTLIGPKLAAILK